MPDNTEKEILEIAQKLLMNLANHAGAVVNKYDYYNADQATKDYGIAMPKNLARIKPGIGWASRAVNTLGDRLNFDGFANDTMGANKLFTDAGAYAIIEKSTTDTLIAGCSFVAITENEGKLKLLPFTAAEATGCVDENTGMLSVGLAVTRFYGYCDGCDKMWSRLGLVPQDYIVFTPDYTAYFENNALVRIVNNPTGRPLLHVITHRQSADRPLGKARISNTVRRIVDEVARLKVRYEIASEFYSTPQRYITGVAEEALNGADFETALGKIWTVTKDEDGGAATVGQLAQMTINQFSDQKKDLARDFCAETALTLRNLGYETSNPTSAESLKSMSDDLLLEAQACQDEMGREIKEIAISLAMLQNGASTYPAEWDTLRPSWKPIFQLDIGAAGDAIYKLFEVMPELKGTTTAYRMLGISTAEAEELSKARTNTSATEFMPTAGSNQ